VFISKNNQKGWFRILLKIKLIMHGFLRESLTEKKRLDIIEVEYDAPVSIEKLLKEAKIRLDFLGLILVDGRNVKLDYMVNDSCQIKLFPMVGGG